MVSHPDDLLQLSDCAFCRGDKHSRCIDKSDPDTRVCGCFICH